MHSKQLLFISFVYRLEDGKTSSMSMCDILDGTHRFCRSYLYDRIIQ